MVIMCRKPAAQKLELAETRKAWELEQKIRRKRIRSSKNHLLFGPTPVELYLSSNTTMNIMYKTGPSLSVLSIFLTTAGRK